MEEVPAATTQLFEDAPVPPPPPTEEHSKPGSAATAAATEVTEAMTVEDKDDAGEAAAAEDVKEEEAAAAVVVGIKRNAISFAVGDYVKYPSMDSDKVWQIIGIDSDGIYYLIENGDQEEAVQAEDIEKASEAEVVGLADEEQEENTPKKKRTTKKNKKNTKPAASRKRK